MLVILRENVKFLGRVGDVVRVSEGYARNFLLPNRMVAVAHDGNIKAIEAQKKSLEKRRLALKSASEELSKKLGDLNIKISRKVGDKNKLFGSVTASDIADLLHAQGYEIEKSGIQLEAPIKSLGDHTVRIKLDPEVAATLKVSVIKEE